MSPASTRTLRAVSGPSESAEPASPAGDIVEQLGARAARGDGDAWVLLYAETFDDLYRHIGYLTHDAQTAEDLTQETYARAFVCLPGFRGRSSFSTWLYGIAMNVVRRYWRDQRRRARAYDRLQQELALRPPTRDVSSEFLRAQRARALLAVLEELPDKLREAYVLCDLRQLPRVEAARQLGITPGNLAVRASRARARIRAELSRLGWLTPREEQTDDRR